MIISTNSADIIVSRYLSVFNAKISDSSPILTKQSYPIVIGLVYNKIRHGMSAAVKGAQKQIYVAYRCPFPAAEINICGQLYVFTFIAISAVYLLFKICKLFAVGYLERAALRTVAACKAIGSGSVPCGACRHSHIKAVESSARKIDKQCKRHCKHRKKCQWKFVFPCHQNPSYFFT